MTAVVMERKINEKGKKRIKIPRQDVYAYVKVMETILRKLINKIVIMGRKMK